METNTTSNLNLADPGQRIGGIIIDNVIINIVTFITFFGMLFTVYEQLGFDLFWIIVVALIFLEIVLFELVIPTIVWRGQTIGKKVIGSKIVKVDGSEVMATTLMKRLSLKLLFALILDIVTLGLSSTVWNIINLVRVFKHPMRRTFNDLVAGTVVVKAK